MLDMLTDTAMSDAKKDQIVDGVCTLNIATHPLTLHLGALINEIQCHVFVFFAGIFGSQ